MAINTPGVLYGRSDTQSFVNGSHFHDFSNPKNRLSYPAFNDEERTLPILTCGECREFASKHLGFSPDPTKVELTSDEKEYTERFQREGSMETQMLMREAGKAMAEMARAQRANNKATK